MNRNFSRPSSREQQDSALKRPVMIPGGLFIIFEGIDGTGKSTQVHLLAEKLRQLGYAVVATREPTDSSYGRKIRELFADRGAVSHEEELELFIADRDVHVKDVIAPALADGCIVICDRYYLSTVAYQGANGLDPAMILKKNESFPVPDLAIILEIDPSASIQRIRNHRNEHPNDFEQEANLREVAANFAAMPQEYIKRIKGAGPIEDVQRLVFEAVSLLLAKKMANTGTEQQ